MAEGPLIKKYVFKSYFSAVFPLNSSYGAEEDRTPDPLLAKQVLSQLSYSPKYAAYNGGPPKYQFWRASPNLPCKFGGPERIRTADPVLIRDVL